ncbi:ATP-binding protein [Streptomyces sp. NPDC059701]|uniref:ATP-binding protein n=1 Tax=Streptomyces sp. NPDC059701 TaxID=3346914 RepID=UPI0036CB16D0
MSDSTGSAVQRARRAWKLPFSAEAEEVAGLRRLVRLHLEIWNLHDLADVAQLCVSELVANVIKHVGPGTPSLLAVSANATRLRIEVTDPNSRALPVLTDAGTEAEGGRGMTLIDAVTDRWGVDLTADRKSTWCELRTSPTATKGQAVPPRVARAADVLELYACVPMPPRGATFSRLGATVAEETAIDVIADLLHWLRAHGRDPDDVLDRAQAHFEAEVAAH